MIMKKFSIWGCEKVNKTKNVPIVPCKTKLFPDMEHTNTDRQRERERERTVDWMKLPIWRHSLFLDSNRKHSHFQHPDWFCYRAKFNFVLHMQKHIHIIRSRSYSTNRLICLLTTFESIKFALSSSNKKTATTHPQFYFTFLFFSAFLAERVAYTLWLYV